MKYTFATFQILPKLLFEFQQYQQHVTPFSVDWVEVEVRDEGQGVWSVC